MKWKIVRATVLGTAHIASNTPCQDDCFADVVSSRDGVDYLVCLVSDGAGSAKEGGTGAELACNTARSSIEAFLGKPEALSFDESIVVEWIKNIRLAIQETADSHDFTSRDFACTLLGAVIGFDNAVFFQIGDGAIVGANSFVNKDVAAFTIVAGSPAKLLSKRFNDAQIAAIIESKWWDKNIEDAQKIISVLTDTHQFEPDDC